jgi:putative SOS response-associated peptidase YedK
MLLQTAARRSLHVRDDKIFTSSFRKAWRCLVLASSLCEPNGDVKPATRHRFSLKGGDPRPLIAYPRRTARTSM